MLEWLERHQTLLLLTAIALLAAGLLWDASDNSSPPALVISDSAPSADGSPIRVEVAGAVARPGVFDLRAGDRVIDALTAAGGVQEGADLSDLNQARRLRDGEKLTVPTLGGSKRVVASPRPDEPLDINLASEAQLIDLPGVGEAYARRIVDSRRIDGPFRSPDELVARKVLPQTTFERIKPLISAGPR